MKTKLIIAGLVVVLAMSLVACATSEPGTVSWEVPIDDFMSEPQQSYQIEVPVGDVLTLTLGSNPTTGFAWSEEAQIDDTGILKQTGHEYIAPESGDDPIAGAAGQDKWTFEALKAGTATVSNEYSRPWEGGEKAEWTYTLTVTVK